jgi:copper chaperone CopZ
MNQATINIKGMHCRSCEILVEDELLKVKGIKKAQVSEKEGVACVYYQGILDHGEVKKAVRKAGYEIGMKDRLPLFSKRIRDYQELGYAFLVLVLLYLIGNETGIFGLAMKTGGSYGSLPVVFLVGLTAGISTCMALVGGLVLAVSARFSETYAAPRPLRNSVPICFLTRGE